MSAHPVPLITALLIFSCSAIFSARCASSIGIFDSMCFCCSSTTSLPLVDGAASSDHRRDLAALAPGGQHRDQRRLRCGRRGRCDPCRRPSASRATAAPAARPPRSRRSSPTRRGRRSGRRRACRSARRRSRPPRDRARGGRRPECRPRSHRDRSARSRRSASPPAAGRRVRSAW